MDFSNTRDIIGKNIRSIRKDRGFTLELLARRLGVSYQQLQKYEQGKNSISSERLKLLATVLGCTMDGLCSGDPFSEAAPETAILISNFQAIPSPHHRAAVLKLIKSMVDLDRSD